MPRRLQLATLALAWALATGSGAQDVEVLGPQGQQDTFPLDDDTPPTIVLQSQILTVDIERLFAQSEFGERLASELRTEQEALSDENRRLADALRAEELDLAERRPDMDPAAFRAEAEAFDEKAEAIRQAQDAKERALQQSLSQGREAFFEAARPVLGQLMLDSGASVIMDRRSVLVSLGAIDVTDAAIGRIDAAIGDGLDTTPGDPPMVDPDPDRPGADP
ncbi:MAG: periplasmic chaperone for outer membrane proteins Skp [Rhodobacteraceae bacterium HLUCCA08]|nr:MAG: periplasmic chaperone for outer membrane proteins Skp [Rhodobacteraceae bacterium HLUCCA08]